LLTFILTSFAALNSFFKILGKAICTIDAVLT